MRLRALTAAVSLALLPFVAVPATAQAGLPVIYDWPGLAAAGAAQLAGPYAAPPGANDWSCAPSAAHPTPVVLVHGASANMTTNWNTISPLLKNNGYCVFALTYGVPEGTPFPADQIGGRNPMAQSAAVLGAFIDRVRAATGASEVDIVGHSEGSLMPNHYVKFLGGAAKVDKYVALTPLWRGTNTAGLNNLATLARMFGLGPVIDGIAGEVFPAAPEFLADSDFIRAMNATPVAAPGVTYTTIMTKYDELVAPYTSGILNAPNATNFVLQEVCPFDFAGHGMVAFDPNATQLILNALDPANTKPLRCQYVSPSP